MALKVSQNLPGYTLAIAFPSCWLFRGRMVQKYCRWLCNMVVHKHIPMCIQFLHNFHASKPHEANDAVVDRAACGSFFSSSSSDRKTFHRCKRLNTALLLLFCYSLAMAQRSAGPNPNALDCVGFQCGMLTLLFRLFEVHLYSWVGNLTQNSAPWNMPHGLQKGFEHALPQITCRSNCQADAKKTHHHPNRWFEKKYLCRLPRIYPHMQINPKLLHTPPTMITAFRENEAIYSPTLDPKILSRLHTGLIG